MSLEYVLNKLIALDPAAKEYLKCLAHKCIKIKCSDFPNRSIYCVFTDTYLQLSTHAPKHLDAEINGPLNGFLRLILEKDKVNWHETKIKIYGDLSIAQALQNLIFKLDIDWEEELSKYTGDVIAYQSTQLLRKLRSYQQHSSSSLEEMITEYLQEESGLLPTKFEINEFIEAVDQLRLETDRLDARISAYASTKTTA